MWLTPLHQVLRQNSAVAGEAAGYGLGLLQAGLGETPQLPFADLLQLAHDSRHEKARRCG
jgi:hypothetical protein